jgi:hypothetical protein
VQHSKIGCRLAAMGQKHALPRRNIDGRFTSISGHNVAAVFLTDAWVMRQGLTSLGNRFPIGTATAHGVLTAMLTLRPTGLSSPAYRDLVDYIVIQDNRAVGRICEDLRARYFAFVPWPVRRVVF